MMIVTGNGTNTIALQDSGNDIVAVGTGSNTVTGGSGKRLTYPEAELMIRWSRVPVPTRCFMTPATLPLWSAAAATAMYS